MLVFIGIIFIYSSGVTASGVMFSKEYIKQTIWAVTGISLLFLFAFIDYSHIKTWAFPLYGFFLFLLILTLIFGKIVNGAKSWIGIWEFGIQPSEFLKIVTILFLALVLERFGPHIKQVGFFLICLVVVIIPMGLVLLQPDLGTASVFLPIFFFMIFAAGADIKHILFLLLIGFLLVIFSILPAYEVYLAGHSIPALSLLTDKILSRYLIGSILIVFLLSLLGYFFIKRISFYWIGYGSLILFFSLFGSIIFRSFLKEYQLMRLIVFLNPSIDPRGAGWNIIQSMTAVGSGGFFGKGFLQGTQSHYRYIPQQSTDFIFSILSEEWGFWGGILIFSLFLVILIRGLVYYDCCKRSIC